PGRPPRMDRGVAQLPLHLAGYRPRISPGPKPGEEARNPGPAPVDGRSDAHVRRPASPLPHALPSGAGVPTGPRSAAGADGLGVARPTSTAYAPSAGPGTCAPRPW